MVKVTVDIEDQYWLTQALTTIEKIARDDNTCIDDVKSLVDVADNAACNCNDLVPMKDGNKEETLEAIKALESKVSNLKLPGDS